MQIVQDIEQEIISTKRLIEMIENKNDIAVWGRAKNRTDIWRLEYVKLTRKYTWNNIMNFVDDRNGYDIQSVLKQMDEIVVIKNHDDIKRAIEYFNQRIQNERNEEA